MRIRQCVLVFSVEIPILQEMLSFLYCYSMQCGLDFGVNSLSLSLSPYGVVMGPVGLSSVDNAWVQPNSNVNSNSTYKLKGVNFNF